MRDYHISVIIPIYNTNPRYLSLCLDSVLNQTLEVFEILLVDSSDNLETLNLINDYARKSDTIRVIKSDKGVSRQRNIGIDSSTGNYIAFIDSDDYVAADYLEKLIFKIEETHSDIAFPQLIKDTYDGGVVIDTFELSINPLANPINEYNFFVNTSTNGLVNPVKLYSKELIGDTRFREDLIHGEDMIFNYELSKKGFNAVFVPNAFYTFTGEKTSGSAKKRFNDDAIRIIEVMYRLFNDKKRVYKKDNLDGIYYQFSYLFSSYYYEAVRRNKTSYLIRFLKYRLLYLKYHHTLKDCFYMFFPYTRKLLKTIMRRK